MVSRSLGFQRVVRGFVEETAELPFAQTTGCDGVEQAGAGPWPTRQSQR